MLTPLSLADDLYVDDLPSTATSLIKDGLTRMDHFRLSSSRPRIASFESANFEVVFGALRAIQKSVTESTRSFCEWGSGFGVVTCLAKLLGFEACGIEIEAALVAEARALAEAYKMNVTFWQGSYTPPGAFEEAIDESQMDCHFGFRPMDFDVIYVYPWPAEERVVSRLVDRYARVGTLLVTYHGGGILQIRQKTSVR